MGDVAMVRIYGRALSASDVQNLKGILNQQEKTYTLGTNGYVAVCLPYIYQVPEGCTAFIVSEIESPTVKLRPIAQAGECVPYGTPVIIKGEAKASITLTALNKNEVDEEILTATIPENLLVGTYPGKTLIANDGFYYVMRTTGTNMYRATNNITLSPFSCYLPSTEKRTYFKIEEEEATGINEDNDNLNLNLNLNKGIYDLSGRRISTEDSSLFTLHSSLKRGIYIKDGKKIVIK